ncbi:hypothetical protein CU023_1107 [Enterococcus faecium]|nr:hypothetical protein [Enterococcus faecium]MBK4874437.1 hypothetical protein [Enterococcus faecium]
MYAVKKVKLVNNRLEKLHRSQQQEKGIWLKFTFKKIYFYLCRSFYFSKRIYCLK